MIYDHVAGEVSQNVAQDLYPLAERNGFYHPEVTGIVLMLNGEGLLEKQSYKGVKNNKPIGRMIGCVRLTSKGALYVRNLREPVVQDDAFDQTEHDISIKSLIWSRRGTIVGILGIIVALVLFILTLYFFKII
jgi:hypothetical protein